MLSPKQLQQRSQAARKGGAAVRDRYGTEWMAALGSIGGRPSFDEALEKARQRERAAREASRPGRRRKGDARPWAGPAYQEE